MTFYEYDLYGNLLSVALPDGRTIEYDVDGAGRRVGRRVLDSQGIELEYRGWICRDLLRPIAEVDSVGDVVARYVYGDSDVVARWNAPDMIEVLDGNGGVEETFFLTKDQMGSVVLVTNSAGEIVQRVEYDAFGVALSNTNASLQPFGFGGGIQEFETGLIRFGARDYEPTTGRWTARDPILFEGGLNLYGYVGNQPVSVFDPLGLRGSHPSSTCPGGTCLNNSWAQGQLRSYDADRGAVGRLPGVGDAQMADLHGAGGKYDYASQGMWDTHVEILPGMWGTEADFGNFMAGYGAGYTAGGYLWHLDVTHRAGGRFNLEDDRRGYYGDSLPSTFWVNLGYAYAIGDVLGVDHRSNCP